MGTQIQPDVVDHQTTNASVDNLLMQAFARLDRRALGIAVGTLTGIGVFVSTLILVLKGGELVGPNLALLGQYFIGYSVSVPGSFVGMGYGLLFGFVLGWTAAFVYNLVIVIYLSIVRLQADASALTESIDGDHALRND